MAATLRVPAKNIVGESAVWDVERKCLLWVDIIGKTIQSFVPETGETRQWSVPDLVTSIGLRRDGGAIVGVRKQICAWDFGEAFRPLITVEQSEPGNRLNEGVVGPDGAFWVGTMQDNIGPDGAPVDITENTGRLYRYAAKEGLTQVCDDRFGITNTFVWTRDGALITADTLRNEIYRYALTNDGRTLTDRRVILSAFDRGLPDGSCIDAEGYIWNCRVVGGACVIRLSPDGLIDKIVDLPCHWPTSCAFGGEDLDTLFVTSARFTMTDEHLDAHPQEGGLFAVDVGVCGCAPYRFG